MTPGECVLVLWRTYRALFGYGLACGVLTFLVYFATNKDKSERLLLALWMGVWMTLWSPGIVLFANYVAKTKP